jgi:hypothetical protein
VHVRSDRRYEFAVGPDELWTAFTRVEDYRSWWPWLRRFEAGGFEPGERWRCTVQPPLPYVLRFDVTLVEVEPHRFVTASVSGDIVGEARIDVRATGTGSEVRLVSALSPSNPMLRAIATMARPVVRFGHDWVLDTGLRQFASRAI